MVYDLPHCPKCGAGVSLAPGGSSWPQGSTSSTMPQAASHKFHPNLHFFLMRIVATRTSSHQARWSLHQVVEHKPTSDAPRLSTSDFCDRHLLTWKRGVHMGSYVNNSRCRMACTLATLHAPKASARLGSPQVMVGSPLTPVIAKQPLGLR